MPKNAAPAAKNAGGQGTPNDQAPVGGGENSVVLAGKSTSDLGANSNLDGSQNAGLPSGSGGTGDKPEGGQDNGNGGAEVESLAPTSGGVVASSAGATFELEAKTVSAARGVLGIEVTAHRDGYRRAGRAWGKAPERVTQDELTEDQIEQLQADPNIRLRGVWIEVEADSEPK